MELNRIPVYLKDVTFKMEKLRDKDVRVCVATLFIQPLTYAIAAALGLDAELYMAKDKPNDILRKGELELGQGKKTHKIELHSTVDASTDPIFYTEDAFVGRTLKARKDKEAPIFAGTIEINFLYPPATQLLAIVNGINEQFWITLAPTNPGLFEEADRESARDEKKRKKKEEQPTLPADGKSAAAGDSTDTATP